MTNKRYTNKWQWEGKPLNSTVEGVYGFVYVITCTANGKKYIGRKNFFLRKKVKGKSRLVESDWKHYWGSNKGLADDIAKYGVRKFTREILHLPTSKGLLAYWEEYEQYARGVLFDENYYNYSIGSGRYRTLKGKV